MTDTTTRGAIPERPVPDPAGPGSQAPAKRTIAFVLYPGVTPLDLVGPLQVLSGLAAADPTYEVVVVGHDREAVPSDTPLRLAADHVFEEVTAPDVVVVPGGTVPTIAALVDERLLGWLRGVAPTARVVASVCTGSLILGAAGLLEGRPATSHWGFRHLLAGFGATPVAERWVESGSVLTAAGVAAGIDMALYLVGRLAGESVARRVQLFIEYDPRPPFGGIDWNASEVDAFRPSVDAMVKSTLAGHPDLLARLTG